MEDYGKVLGKDWLVIDMIIGMREQGLFVAEFYNFTEKERINGI